MRSDLTGAESITTEPWASIEDLAKHLRVAKDSVDYWIEQTGMPAHRLGGCWKIQFSQIEHWLHTDGAGDDNNKEPLR